MYGISDKPGPVVYSRVSCNGWERSITDCTKSEYLGFTCSGYTHPAGVLCTDGMLHLNVITDIICIYRLC